MPNPRKHWLQVSALVIALMAAISFYLWVTWPDRTMERFTELIRKGDLVAAHAMLVPIDDRHLVIDNLALQAAIERGPESEDRTLADLLQGRERFDVSLLYANDHSITVERGRIVLGDSYYRFDSWPSKEQQRKLLEEFRASISAKDPELGRELD